MRKPFKRIVSCLCAAALVVQLVSTAAAVGRAADSKENLALGKAATATYEQMSSDYQAYAGNAVDGDYNSRWSTFGGPSLPAAIQVDLGAECELDGISTYWFGSGRTYTYSVYVTDEPVIVDRVMVQGAVPAASGLTGKGSGSASSPTVSGTPGTLKTDYQFDAKVTGRYLTIACTKVAGSSAAVLWELEAYGRQIGETQKAGILKIPRFTQRRVAFGTDAASVSLPESTTVTLDNGKKEQVGLQWSCPDYNGSVPGTYEFTGVPVLGEESGISNPDSRTASLLVTVCEADADLSGRQSVSLCDGWAFQQGALPGAQELGFNDAFWDTVDIPHTWNALDGQDGGNNYYRGDGWYRKLLDWNEDYAGKRLSLEFLGANMQADVYVNGVLIGTHKGGYTAFRYDITDALIPGQENLLAVKVNNQKVQDIAPITADFTFFGGIYREVSLLVTDPVHIDTADCGSSGLYLTQTNVSRESADLEIRSNIVNDSAVEKTVTVRAELRHPDNFEEIAEVPNPAFDPAAMAAGGTVLSREMTLTIPAGGSAEFKQDVTVENPHLWNGREDPYRYQVDLQVAENGEKLDSQTGYVGFRTYTVDYDNGFFLNGESYPLRGVSRHQDREDMGNALTQKEHDEDFGLIYEMGVNALRLAHYPQAPYFYDLCDRYGIVVWAEIPFVNNVGGSGSYESPDADRQAFFDVTKQQLVELIRQQYNRPSICFWGLQNEVLAYNEAMPQFMAELNDLAHREDPTRLTTQATDKAAAQAWASDLIAWNRYPGWYFGVKEDMGKDLDTNHAADNRPFAISEYGVGSNIEHHLDKATNADKNMAVQSEEYQNICHESFIEQINARPYLWATFVWNMFDFSSDGRSEGGMTGINTKGLVTRDRQTKKDSFYLYKANWSSEPFVHITSSRNNPRKNSPVEVKGYSNCDSVELTVNGTLVGRLTQDELQQKTVFVWEDVSLASGTNTVVMKAEKDGQTYTDTVVWEKLKSSDTTLSSDVLTVDNSAKTIALSSGVNAEELEDLLQSYGASFKLFASDGTTAVSTGKVLPGMILRVTSEDGTQTASYTFVQACLSTGKPVEASSYQNNKDGNNPPSYATDGDASTRWAAGLTEDGTSTSYPQWITVDLGTVCALSRIDVSWFQSSTQRKYYYTVSVSEDGEKYTPAADRSANTTSGLVSDSLDGAKGRFVRIDVTGNSNWPGNKSSAASIYEIKVYGEAVTVDKQQLSGLYDKYFGLPNDNYTQASWDTFSSALDNAKKTLDGQDATQQQVDEAAAALNAAVNGLTKAADKTELNKAIAEAKELTESDYTPASWAELKQALGEAEKISADPNALQDAADAAAAALSTAVDKLVKAADKTELNKAIAEAKELTESDYTPASWAELKQALGEAEKISLDPNAAQDAADGAAANLNSAIENLVPAGTVPSQTQKTILKAVLDYAAAARGSEEYAAVIASVKVSFDSALNAAQEVYNRPDAAQQQVDDAWKALLHEIHKLGFQSGSKDVLRAMEEQGARIEKNLGLYMDGAPKTAFISALQAARGVLADGDALKEDVSQAEEALLNAMMNLRFRADKSVLEQVLGKARAIDLTLYLPETVEVFNRAVNAGETVFEDENATQEQVQAAADQIEAAIDSLAVFKTGDVSTQTGAARNAATGEALPLAAGAAALLAGFVLTRRRRR